MIRPKFYIIATDLCLAIIALYCGYLLRFLSFESAQSFVQSGYVRLFFYLSSTLFSSYFFELYEKRNFYNKRFLVYRIPAVFVLSFLVLSVIFYIAPSHLFGRGVLFISLLCFSFFQFGFRLLILKFSNRAQFATKILVVGAGELAQQVADMVPEDDNPHSYVRFIACTNKEAFVDKSLVVGRIDEIDDIVKDYKPQKIVIALTERRGNLPLKEFMQSKLRGIEILDAVTFFEQEKQCLMVEGMQPSAFIYTQGFRMTPFMRTYKRIYDVIFSTVGLAMSAPIFPVLAVMIKLDSPGPVFF